MSAATHSISPTRCCDAIAEGAAGFHVFQSGFDLQPVVVAALGWSGFRHFNVAVDWKCVDRLSGLDCLSWRGNVCRDRRRDRFRGRRD
jgi:hypothetical protein